MSLARELDYRGAGTVEFLVDCDTGKFSFLEINTRVQVEHPVTEVVTGVDIVRQQIRIAAGEPLGFTQDDVVVRGHAIECRINAESVADGFLPSPGTITTWNQPVGEHVRVDTHAFAGYDVPPYYDSLVAKLIVGGADRQTAIESTLRALEQFEIEGIATTVDLQLAVLSHADFRGNTITTRWLETALLPALTKEHRHDGMRHVAEIDIIDQTLRDGQQSLWGMRMKVAHLADVADDIDQAGYRVVDLTGSSIFECMMRYNREDPWDGLDLWRTWMPNSQAPLRLAQQLHRQVRTHARTR